MLVLSDNFATLNIQYSNPTISLLIQKWPSLNTMFQTLRATGSPPL